ncbi:MAG: hypothetical protein FJX29_08295 [Alphaproteobacteria bacterium]|nr:hypothetical protein [Alphaproteobacteria bacterium]
MRFLPAEKAIIAIILTLAAADLALLAVKPLRVDVQGYAFALAIGAGLLATGQYYRVWRKEEGIALAATGAALFTIFSIVCSVFNYLLLPVPRERIDALLAAMDAATGFDWPSAVGWVTQRESLSLLLKIIYQSSLVQLFLIVLFLGFSRQEKQLHKFLLTGLISTLGAVMFWSFFPSAGAASAYDPARVAEVAKGLVAGPEYISALMGMISHGVTSISPKDTLGLIAFPSVHTVMACMSVAYVISCRWLFVPLAAVNLLMLPATIVHGNHHLMDIFGGLALFAFAAFLAHRLVERHALSAPASALNEPARA